MRILYVSGESPITPAGGIATYLQYMVPAMRAAGHEVFLFSWVREQGQALQPMQSPFKPENTWISTTQEWSVRAQFPGCPTSHALANHLLPELLRCIEEWRIDVIEATDFLSPALPLYQHLGTTAQQRSRLCVSYFHGFVEDFFEADYLLPAPDKMRDLSGERQQCRISDLIIAPSHAASLRLARYGVDAPAVELIREPYRFASAFEPADSVLPAMSYIGRISLSKGIDALVYLANALDAIRPLQHIRLIGREVPTPFRTSPIRDYVRGRLCERLRDKVDFLGFLPRDQARALLQPGEIAPQLGYAETFSYACIESIDQGLVPVVRAGTPMAEFFPPELQHLVFESRLGTPQQIQTRFEHLCSEFPRHARQLREFNEAALAPAKIAGDMSEAYDKALRRKQGKVSLSVARAASAADVTILIPAYKPGSMFVETVDALVGQSVGGLKVLICDDGTPQSETEWFDYARMRLPDCRIIRQANGGLLAARNTLIAHLETPLAVFIDADDLLDPAYIERVLEAWNHAPDQPNAVLTQRWNFDQGSELVLPNLLGDHVHLLCNDFRMTALIEADVLRGLGFDPLRRNGEADDWDFWLRFTAAGYHALMVPEPLFRYRFRVGTMSWPWSSGQTMGTNAMLTEAVTRLIEQRPHWAGLVAKALSNARSFD